MCVMGETPPEDRRESRAVSRTYRVTTGAAGVTAAVAAFALWRSVRPSSRARKDTALVGYLRDHLSGSDVAIHAVQRLALTSASSSDAEVYHTLVREFDEERAVVRELLAREGASSRSPKRVAASVSGAMLRFIEGADASDVARFEALEGLAIGIQSKRCLWRALQALAASVSDGVRFKTLEAQAVRQWDVIEARRRMLAVSAFPPLAPHA
jgi:hypothetical protein